MKVLRGSKRRVAKLWCRKERDSLRLDNFGQAIHFHIWLENICNNRPLPQLLSYLASFIFLCIVDTHREVSLACLQKDRSFFSRLLCPSVRLYVILCAIRSWQSCWWKKNSTICLFIILSIECIIIWEREVCQNTFQGNSCTVLNYATFNLLGILTFLWLNYRTENFKKRAF